MSSIGNQIQSGTAQGLLDFLDYVAEKGYGTTAAVSPLKSAVRQVFSVVEGSEQFADSDVRDLELDDLLARFETKAKGDLKVESIRSYCRRFERAHTAYVAFLETGRTPSFATRTRPKAAAAGRSPAPRGTTGAESAAARSSGSVAHDPPAERMIEYPFPLRSGQVATLRLPVTVERQDAERLAAYIRALVFSSPGESE